MTYDLVTFGEAMLRLSVPAGVRMETTDRLDVSVAGAEANVAVAVARMGRSATWISRLPDSSLGRRVARQLAWHGVDISHVRWVDGSRVGTLYVELSVEPRPIKVTYDRESSAAAGLSSEDIPWEVLEAAGVVHLTGITPALSRSCLELSLECASRMRAAGVPLAVDINYRSGLWSPKEARETLVTLCRRADVVIVAQREAQVVFNLDGDSSKIVGHLQEMLEAKSVILALGSAGCVWSIDGVEGETSAQRADVIDRVGVGDAFAAGVLLGLLEGDCRRGVDYGTAMAALKLGVKGDQFLGSADEVQRVMGRQGTDIQR